jgi:hypothetical protein
MIIEVMGLAGWKIKTYSKRVIERDIEHAKDYKKNLGNPFVVNVNDMFNDLKTDGEYHSSDDRIGMHWLLPGCSKLSEIADLDVEWTKERNKGYLYEVQQRYTLKPETQAKITVALDEFIDRATKALDDAVSAEDAKKRAYEEEKTRLLDSVTWDVNGKQITDEGGKTMMYEHIVTVDGKKFVFTERSLFDVGRVINPKRGGLISRDSETGKYYREKFNDANGWNRVEDLDEDEARAYEIVLKYGKYAGTGIRM